MGIFKTKEEKAKDEAMIEELNLKYALGILNEYKHIGRVDEEYVLGLLDKIYEAGWELIFIDSNHGWSYFKKVNDILEGRCDEMEVYQKEIHCPLCGVDCGHVKRNGNGYYRCKSCKNEIFIKTIKVDLK